MFPTVAVQGYPNVVGSLSDAGQRANVNDRKKSKSIDCGGSSRTKYLRRFRLD